MDYFNNLLDTYWALIVYGSLLPMEGLRALGMQQKYLNLCSEDEYVLPVLKKMRVSNAFSFLGELSL